MRLVDFLAFLLEAHARTLQALAELLGEDTLLELLERSLDSPPGDDPAAGEPSPEWFESAGGGDWDSPYSELQESVDALGLAPALEHHLWSYPHYRAFVESSIDLGARIAGQPSSGAGPGRIHPLQASAGNAGTVLVEEAVAQAEEWLRRLPLRPEARKQAEALAHAPWLRFRSSVLKRIGRRPLGPVY